VNKLNSWTKACTLFLLWTATAITLPAQTFTPLHSFNGTDGNNSQAALVQATNGDLYGTTISDGASGGGTIFKMTPGGAFTLLHSFDGTDGVNPWNALVQATDGSLYGTTNGGGVGTECHEGCGTVFKVTLGGTLTSLHSFIDSDGLAPQGGLVQGTNGDFYGTTILGGANSVGTVYRFNLSRKLTTLYAFDNDPGTEGDYPYSGMIQATDGNFYGTTISEGESFEGTIFKITPGGTLTTLYNFCSVEDCADGRNPIGGLVQSNDGNLYGETSEGGVNNYLCGTLFKITLNGTLTTLHSFSGPDGCSSLSQMVQGTDGNFYGVTSGGGTSTFCAGGACGTIFSITPTGSFTTLYNFCPASGCADGASPTGQLIQDTNGTFYGTTAGGGANNEGAVYSLSMGLLPFVKTQTTSGAAGASVVILGTNLTGATGVTFNGTAATFAVVSSSEITTTVPAGATTGKVKVTLPHGTLISSVNFAVTP
jgi:uncharacterized repeat protein (TIGR03803 family)